MENNSIRITYESLFELLRNEKNREELQELDKDFFKNIIEYLEEKNSILNKPDDNIFIKSEKEKATQQLSNTKRIIKDLFQRREKKIISMALIKSRVDAKVDISSLLEEEKLVFDQLVKLFNNVKKGILNNIIDGKMPEMSAIEEKPIEKIITEVKEKQEQECADENNSMIRFIQYVPSFLGTDLNNYGPFEPEDLACIPNRIVKLLVEKKAAERIDMK